jgi:hypothetical protein
LAIAMNGTVACAASAKKHVTASPRASEREARVPTKPMSTTRQYIELAGWSSLRKLPTARLTHVGSS